MNDQNICGAAEMNTQDTENRNLVAIEAIALIEQMIAQKFHLLIWKALINEGRITKINIFILIQVSIHLKDKGHC